MVTRAGARLQVVLDLQRRHGLRRGWEELVIVDEYTIERPWGWVFFYTTRGWRHGDINYALGGNAPYMVNRNGSIRFAGTALPIEEHIRTYEAELERQVGAWELCINESSDCSLGVASAMRLSLGMSVADLGALKRRLPCVVATGASMDLEPACQRLIAAGVRAEVRRAAQPKVCEGQRSGGAAGVSITSSERGTSPMCSPDAAQPRNEG